MIFHTTFSTLSQWCTIKLDRPHKGHFKIKDAQGWWNNTAGLSYSSLKLSKGT